jgi:hypothetical protein
MQVTYTSPMAEQRRSKGKKAAAAKRPVKSSSRAGRPARPGAAKKAAQSRTRTGKARPKREKAPTAKTAPAAKAAGKKATVRRKAPSRVGGARVVAKGERAGRSKSPRTEISSAALVTVSSSEEERIESAKYAGPASRRVFEEERFVFPETYGVNRVRLLVKDPEWLFAHWDVNPETLASLGVELGSRAVELSKLTLKVFDPANGGASVILLPAGARSWYLRADSRRRAYRAELGVTLPSGEFRVLAESNTVVAPRVGPSHERASRVLPYRLGRTLPAGAGLDAAAADLRSASGAGQWSPVPDRVAPAAAGDWAGSPGGPGGASESFGPPGASESFGPGGASDVHRR